MDIRLRIGWFSFLLNIEEEPLANLIGNVVTDAMDRREEGESKNAIGFLTSKEPDEPVENERRI